VLGDVDGDFLHDGDGEWVELSGADAGRLHLDARAGEMAEDRFGHRRAHGVAATGEENGARQLGVFPRQGIIPSSAARRSA
jgi:hypothetical protein